MAGSEGGRKQREEGGSAAPLFAEVVDGLNDLAAEELRALGADLLSAAPDGLRFVHDAPYRLCRQARLVSAVYRELRFAVPRPKALLGDEAMR
ncbi:MAG TPA: THUMP domain-containing protein, partial [Trueperaceae bacterium]|nr:THUMP domain-containing protein [Trueperaceae bacterium]